MAAGAGRWQAQGGAGPTTTWLGWEGKAGGRQAGRVAGRQAGKWQAGRQGKGNQARHHQQHRVQVSTQLNENRINCPPVPETTKGRQGGRQGIRGKVVKQRGVNQPT